MSAEVAKVGIISCSGEALPEGTISRLATRRVLELLRPDRTVTLCLPLFLAGNEGERNFARTHPTITVDGCEKQCAKWGTEKHSGPVSVALVVPEILQSTAGCHCSTRALTEEDTEAVWAVAERIAAEVDSVLASSALDGAEYVESGAGRAQCACSSPLPGGKLAIGGKTVEIPGLPLIFAQHAEQAGAANGNEAAALLDLVKIYHPIAPEEQDAYKSALLGEYRKFVGMQAAK
ncbi:MAG: putative zinc-binding protein [Terracidiphilus sp.]